MKSFFNFVREERAVIAATTAVLMPAFILFLALGVEVGEWYAVDRQLQTVSDAAAVAAALELANGGTISGAQTKAGYSATKDGYSGTPTVTCLTTYNPDVVGSCASSTTTGYVKAIVSKSQPTIFANLFATSVTVGASTVAAWTQPYQSCGLALGATGNLITATGTPTINLGTGCVLASQSISGSPASLDLSLATSVTAQTLISAGGLKCSASCNTLTPPIVDGPIIPNPLSCALAANANFCSAVTAIPGGCSAMPAAPPAPPAGGVCYNSMVFSGGTTVTLPAGTYYTPGNFDVQNGTVNGSGVTIVLTSASVCEGNVSFEGSANLAAPSSGTFAGMLFIQMAPSGVTCSSSDAIASAAPSVTLAGGIYSPDAAWTFNSTPGPPASPVTSCLAGVSPCTAANKCLTVTANVLVFAGTGTLDLEDAGCTSPTGTNLFNIAAVSLVE